ncbi:hypothetical protein K9L16_01445, partial [Candidatus Pacearchaeota archaeon]|nr:hypothetical protein [Candidatus Pacearchaeota archaeon]
MKFNFKKISAITSSLLVAGMSITTPVLAANYPAPFVSGSSSDVAIVYGASAASTDIVEAGNIQLDLQNSLGGSTGGETTVEGEAYALFTDSRKIYMNDSINSVRSTLTDTQLPTVLADSDFNGNVDADVSQKITLSSNPRVVYGKHPDSSSDDPTVAIELGTTVTNYAYNATVTFNKAVDLTDSDSTREALNIFGKQYKVGASTTATDLILYESSETIALSIGGSDPSSTTVDVNGETYTVELVSASDNDARLQVTDGDGVSDTNTVSEGASKKIRGIDIAVDYSDEDIATNRLIAEITVGADKIKLTDGNEVREGSDEEIIDGTQVSISGGNWNTTTGFTIQVFVYDSDENAIVEGESFTDPVFGSFKIDFASLTNMDDTETFVIANSGDDTATVEFTSHTGDTKKVNWYYNESSSAMLGDSSGYAINVLEGAQINKSEYAMVGNENVGYLVQLKSVSNSSSATPSDDVVEFEDVMTGSTYTADITQEGSGTILIGTEEYDVTYVDSRTVTGDEYVTLNYPDSTGNDKVIYPTIETSKEARLSFYEPITLTLGTDVVSGGALRLPDGDGYTDVTITFNGTEGFWNVTHTSTEVLDTTGAAGSAFVDFTVGELTYNLTDSSATNNATTLYLQDVSGTNIDLPGIVIFEEQDDSTNRAYNAIIVKMEGAGTSGDGVGVSDVEFTWGSDSYWNELQSETDDDLYYSMDYYGVISETDRSESDQYTATITYPDQ